MATKEQTEKAVETQKDSGGSGAAPRVSGKVAQESGVKAIVNPALGDSRGVGFPTGEGDKMDFYETGKTHEVPQELLDAKNASGVAYLVEDPNADSEDES